MWKPLPVDKHLTVQDVARLSPRLKTRTISPKLCFLPSSYSDFKFWRHVLFIHPLHMNAVNRSWFTAIARRRRRLERYWNNDHVAIGMFSRNSQTNINISQIMNLFASPHHMRFLPPCHVVLAKFLYKS